MSYFSALFTRHYAFFILSLCLFVDMAAEEYNAFFYTLVSTVSLLKRTTDNFKSFQTVLLFARHAFLCKKDYAALLEIVLPHAQRLEIILFLTPPLSLVRRGWEEERTWERGCNQFCLKSLNLEQARN